MHGAAAPAATAVTLAVQLGHQGVGRHALGQRMAVAAMGTGNPVGLAQMGAYTYPRCLLANIQMQEARGFALAAGDLRGKFEAAQQQHLLVQPQQLARLQPLWQCLNLNAQRPIVHRCLNFQKSRENPAVQPPSTVSTCPVM